MPDRENSPAYAALRRSARRVFAAIERTIGDGSSASVSYVDFRLDQHIARKAVSPSLKLLDHLGLIEIEPGPRLVNVFRFSNRWRSIDEVEAVRLAALAREVKPHRTFAKSPESKPVKPSKPKPMTVARRTIGSGGTRKGRRALRRRPSLAVAGSRSPVPLQIPYAVRGRSPRRFRISRAGIPSGKRPPALPQAAQV